MLRRSPSRTVAFVPAILCGCVGISTAAEPAGQNALAGEILRSAGVAGGLCVHLGGGDAALSVALSDNGRFLVHALVPDEEAAARAVRHIRSRGVYGQVWAERISGQRLPYAENLVNLLVADAPAGTKFGFAEILRVLCPNGVVCVRASSRAAEGLKRRLGEAGLVDAQILRRGGVRVRARKPWPRDMDEWGHPRHGPDGNAVSSDGRVGPPRRVRWVSGPMHEASNMVTAGGRLFYGGLVACDAFNGLRLWERKLDPTPLRLGYPARAVAGSVLPVAAGDRLYVVTKGKLQALDAATGRTALVYTKAATPREILYDQGVLVAVGAKTVQALDARSGKLLWSQDTAQPASAVAGGGSVYLLEGSPRRGGASPRRSGFALGAGERSIVRRDMADGRPVWRRSDYPWAARVRRLMYHQGLLVCEVSTFSNDRSKNGIHVLAAGDGALLWQRAYEPGMSHYMQARAVHTGGLLWVLHKKGWEGLDPRTGAVRKTYPAPIAHCYPPVATRKYFLAGEMGFTDAKTGRLDANRITKGACGRDAGFVPGNGLIYCAPKHCACWPMLRGYVALAPARASGGAAAKKPAAADFVPERGPASRAEPQPAAGPGPAAEEWPGYRADMWRSGSTTSHVPAKLEVLWTRKVGDRPRGRLRRQWDESRLLQGPITSPVVAAGMVFVAQGDAHRVVALDARTGEPRWDFTVNGRVDTPPTISRKRTDSLHHGRCVFGTRSGWVYCLRVRDGGLIWRLRAAPHEERIVYFGQLESPWPVAGSVLVAGGVAYFAAGRHPLADGGVLVFAADPATGKVRWVQRIASLPIRNFYAGAGLEFDPVDLLVAEADRPRRGATTAPAPTGPPDRIAMSRWKFSPGTGRVTASPTSGFGYYRAGRTGVMAPRGLWTYGLRMDYIPSGPPPGKPDYVRVRRRPLMVFRGNSLFGTSDDKRRLFRRDFTAEQIAKFDDTWFRKRQVLQKKDRSQRLAEGAVWAVNVFGEAKGADGVGAMVLAGETVFVAGSDGRLAAFAAEDGKKLSERDLPPPAWDGMAAAYGRLYVATRDGSVICLGAK